MEEGERMSDVQQALDMWRAPNRSVQNVTCNEAAVRLWVQELRTGSRAQGFGYLRNGGRFCCLGVACEVMLQEGGNIQRYRTPGASDSFTYVTPSEFGGDAWTSRTILPHGAAKWLGFAGLVNTARVWIPQNVWEWICSNGAASRSFSCAFMDEGQFFRLSRLVDVTWLNDTLEMPFLQIADCVEYTYLPGDWELRQGGLEK